MLQAEHNPTAPPTQPGDAAHLANDLLRPMPQQFTARVQAHFDHLKAHQRASGKRIRLCTSGCYAVYNAEGYFIARTAPPGMLTGLPLADLKTAASRMAYSEELAILCRAADIDYENTGTVAPATIVAIRKLLDAVDNA